MGIRFLLGHTWGAAQTPFHTLREGGEKRHQRTVIARWLPVARDEHLCMRIVYRAQQILPCPTCAGPGVSLHITSYVYL